MKTVLSTKVLSPAQKELFLNSGIGLVEYAALEIEFLQFQVPTEFNHFIFTSKNGVKAFLNQAKAKEFSNQTCFCVGEKTSKLLQDKGLKVSKMAQNSSDLGDFISKNHKNSSFLHFCGNLRRPELPNILTKNNIRYKEIEAYETQLTPKKFGRSFDGILFFSPSGIKSFVQENQVGESTLFCIGATTAREAKKHSSDIVIASKPTVENVLVKAIKHLKKHD